MATTKKTASKKTASRSTATKKAAPKKTVAKKAPARKKAPAKKTTRRASAKSKGMQSFRVSQDTPPFMSFKLTRQTLYWVILIAFIIFAQLWIISLQVEVAGLIEAQQQLLTDSL